MPATTYASDTLEAPRTRESIPTAEGHIAPLGPARPLTISHTSPRSADYISNASHELRTLLAIVDSSAQLLMESAGADGKAALHASKIRRAIARAEAWSNNFFCFLRLEEGSLAFNPAPCNLKTIAEEVCRRASFQWAGGALSFSVAPADYGIAGDAGLLGQAVANLVSNAQKFAPHGQTHVALHRDARHVAVTVTDQGCGIPPEDMPRLFTPYFRASNAQGTRGSGLGLYVAQRLVELHGGKIRAASELGQGAAFTLLLPAV